MKKFILVYIILMTVFICACNSERHVSEEEIPLWLKERIAEDEAVIDSDPKLMQNYGAWFRYKYHRDYYFEYKNPFMSACCFMYDFNGVSYSYDDFEEYENDKCCERVVWKAPGYDELSYNP